MQAVDLYDADWYASASVHETFAELRRTSRVLWQDIPDQPGFWAVLRHADVVEVARDPGTYSSWLGGVMLDTSEGEALEQTRGMLLTMDPPQHTEFRHPLMPHFGARVVGRMEAQIRELCRAVLDAVDGEVDFVYDVARELPARVIAVIMGLPSADIPQLQRWTDVQLGGQDEEVRAGYEGNALVEMAMYAAAFAADRRAAPPRDDVTSLLLESMDDNGFGFFFAQLVTAANDTTKTLISSGTHALVEHPDQLEALRSDPHLVPNAVEEMLRYGNPVHYMRRTATQDAVLGDVKVAAGDKVAMIFTSANRDEDVFDDPQRFDITRSPNPHLSFGMGTHFCLGAHLARLESRVFFEELLATFPTVERAGEPAPLRSNLINGYKRVPIRLGR